MSRWQAPCFGSHIPSKDTCHGCRNWVLHSKLHLFCIASIWDLYCLVLFHPFKQQLFHWSLPDYPFVQIILIYMIHKRVEGQGTARPAFGFFSSLYLQKVGTRNSKNACINSLLLLRPLSHLLQRWSRNKCVGKSNPREQFERMLSTNQILSSSKDIMANWDFRYSTMKIWNGPCCQ